MQKKTILVTGGTSGLGRSICKTLAAAGFNVFGTGRRVPEGGERRDGYTLIPMDVTKIKSVKKALKYILDNTGRLDVLVNNAGLSAAGPLEETAMADARKIFDANVFGLLGVTQAVLPTMRNQKKGLIINISSLAGQMGLPFRSIYSASKYCVEAFTESLSMEVREFGIRVCVLEPGDIRTELNQNRQVAELPAKSPYRETFAAHVKLIEKEMDAAMDPAIMGAKVLKIINQKNPPLRAQVGPFIQKLSTLVKKLLPARVFEKILLAYYKL